MDDWEQELEPIYFGENFISQLENKSPYLWDQIVESLNPDDPNRFAVIEWISSQPTCDKATVLNIFVNFNLADFASENFSGTNNESKLARLICQNLGKGFYETALFFPSHLAASPETVWEELQNNAGLDSENAAVLKELFVFDYPAEDRPYTGYFGDEGGLYPIKQSFPKEMWHLFGVSETST